MEKSTFARDQITSVARVVDILSCFTDNTTEWTLRALEQSVDLPRTTLFRYLSTLVSCGYLTQDPVRKSYRVGTKLLLLSSAVVSQSNLRTRARPILERLAATVKETVNLVTLIDHDIFYLDKVEDYRTIICHTRIGSRIPAYHTACGKAILAYMSADYVDEYCVWMRNCMPPTNKTITNPNRLRKELAAAKINGYAIDTGETEEGLVAVGAPLFDSFQHVIGGISVAGPAFRMDGEKDTIIQEVKIAARSISKLSGYDT